MKTPRQIAEETLKNAEPRPFYKVLFGMANTYNQVGQMSFDQITIAKNAEFAGPAIMCQSFAIELLLKFFIATRYPDKSFKQLRAAGVDLRGHAFSILFDRISDMDKERISASYSKHTKQTCSPHEFRNHLQALGDEPFVTWRYVYEAEGNSHIDPQKLGFVSNSLGLAAQGRVREISSF